MKSGDVAAACADALGIDLERFWPYGFGPRRSARQVRARRLAALILRCEGLSYPEIARELGYRDHTTVVSLVSGAKRHDFDDAATISLFLGMAEAP